MTREALLAEALALPKEVRADLVRELARSLDSSASDDTEAKWAAEVARRVRLYREGKLEAVSFETAVDGIRSKLAERRG